MISGAARACARALAADARWISLNLHLPGYHGQDSSRHVDARGAVRDLVLRRRKTVMSPGNAPLAAGFEPSAASARLPAAAPRSRRDPARRRLPLTSGPP